MAPYESMNDYNDAYMYSTYILSVITWDRRRDCPLGNVLVPTRFIPSVLSSALALHPATKSSEYG